MKIELHAEIIQSYNLSVSYLLLFILFYFLAVFKVLHKLQAQIAFISLVKTFETYCFEKWKLKFLRQH